MGDSLCRDLLCYLFVRVDGVGKNDALSGFEGVGERMIRCHNTSRPLSQMPSSRFEKKKTRSIEQGGGGLWLSERAQGHVTY